MKPGVEIYGSKTLLPQHKGDDHPIYYNGRGDQATRLLHNKERKNEGLINREHEGALTHKGYLNDMVVFEVEVGLKLVLDLCSREGEKPITRL